MTCRPSLAALLVAAPAPALAQAAPPPDIVVTGRGLDAAPRDAAFSIVTIDRARIETEASGRLEGVLADVAGLQQFRRSDSRSANPTSQGITLRGLGGNASSRALLILDGVPQADPFGGWVAFPAYSTDRLGIVRVTRGGGSGYFGPGALAGTIELESATPAQLAPLEASAAYGSRDSIDTRGAATLARAAGFATASAAYTRGDGFTPVIAEDRGPIDRPAPYEQASAALRGVIGLGGDTELQANASAFTDNRERGTPFTRNHSEGADASVRLVGRGRWGFAALAYVQTRAFASSFASIDDTRTTARQVLDQYNTPATGLGARVELSPPLGDTLSLRLGGDVRNLAGRTEERFTFAAGSPTRLRRAGGTTDTLGAFADGSAELGRVTFTLGGRLDKWRITDGSLVESTIATGALLTNTRFADRNGTEPTGRAGIAWRAAEALTLRAAAYRGWRLPTLNELYRPFRVGADATAANAALRPEHLTGYEAGATLAPAAGVSLSGTVFRNRLTDGIANVTIANGPGQFPGVGFVGAAGQFRMRRNLDAVRVTGFELDGSAEVGLVEARASWSHVSPRVEVSDVAAPLDGLRPAQTPRDSVSATLGLRRENQAVSLTLRHVSAQFEDDLNTRALAPATTLDAYLTVPITRALLIEARAENLFDERAEAGISGADVIERATPRTLWIGLRYRPGKGTAQGTQ